MKVTLRYGGRAITVELTDGASGQRAVVDGREYPVEARYLDADTLLLEIEGTRHTVHLARRGRERFVGVGGEKYHLTPETQDSDHQIEERNDPEIRAPMPGKVLQVLVEAGAEVAAGDGLLIVEAMKMENRLDAPAAGVVAEMRAGAGDMVAAGQVLVVLRYTD